jgi:dihydrolipoamide dehydrogenase
MSQKHDLIVIGGGPAGYVAAIRAGQLGLDVACVEKASQLGGTCLRVGCIPSKAMLESSERFEEAQHGLKAHGIDVGKVKLDLQAMLGRKQKIVDTMAKGVELLFKKNKVTRYEGHAHLTDDKTVAVKGDGGSTNELRAKHIVIATGSKPATLRGVDLDDPLIDTSAEALAYDKVPGHLVVIGGGYIGLELGTVWRRLGAKVTVVEYLDRLLPGMDGELAAEAEKVFRKQGLDLHLRNRVTSARTEGKGVRVELDGKPPITADRCLVAVGRVPNTDGLGLDEIGVKRDDRGRIVVDGKFQTSVKGVYAIGDVIAGPMLAHKAEEDAVACVERIVTGHGHVDYAVIPAIVYTHPEIATVGQTEDQLKDEDHQYKRGVFSFRANGRAHALNDPTGWVKVLADARTDRVLGVHIIGPRAGDLIAECATAMAFGASSEDIARTCHAHPTLSEAVREAAMAVTGPAIHM